MITLVDYQKQTKNPLFKGLIADLLRYSDLMAIIPFEDVPGLQVSAARWSTMPSAGFRKLGGSYTESTGRTEQIAETLALLGGDIKIDSILTKVQDVYEDPLTTQMRMKAKSIAFSFNDAFINGDQAVNPDTFEGLKKRVANAPSRMTVWLDSNGNGTGTTLDVLASAANQHKFIDALHAAIKYTDGGNCILMNEVAYLGVSRTLRRLSTDLVGAEQVAEKMFETFKGAKLVDVGLKSDKSTEIITSTEAPNSDSTSIYVVRIDTDDGLHGIQLQGTSPEPYDPIGGGEMDTGPQILRRIDWAVGLMNISQYAVCRIAGLKFV